MRILVVDDQKPLHMVAAMIYPGDKVYMSKDETDTLETIRHTWEDQCQLAITLEDAMAILKSNKKPFDIICLDYDLDGDNKGDTISTWLKNNPDQLPDDVYLITLNPYGRFLIHEDLKTFYSFHEEMYRVVHLLGRRDAKESKGEN